MSEKSGVSEQVLSLPSGGGALEGIGGEFGTQTQTGAGKYSIPLTIPDGRNGVRPELALTYSTGSGDGPFGMGWSLGIGAVSRRTRNGVPEYTDEDGFTLPGAGDLVAIEKRTDGETTVTRYRPRTEGSFQRIEHHRSETTDHWIVEEPNGSVRRYGTPDSAGTDPAVVADPADRSKVLRWQLVEHEDQFGNRVVYEYDRDAGGKDGRKWDRVYPDRIKYVDYEVENGDTAYLVSIEFDYAERPEPISHYRSGFEIRTRWRCRSIRVQTHAGEDRLVRRYALTYRDDLPDGSLAANGASQLAKVDVIGHANGDTQRLPPVEFEYSRFDPEDRDFETLDGPLPRRSLARPELELADLSGDGLPDVVEIDDGIRYWQNRGDGEFDEPRPMDNAPVGLSLGASGVQLLDADGDGRIDLTIVGGEPSGYFPLGRDGGWDDESFQLYDVTPSVDFDDPNVQLVDLDGDGVTDAMRSGDSLEYFFQDEDGWTETRTATGGLDDLEQLDLSDPRIRLADLSGDGLVDIVMVDDGHISYWPNLGHSEWGQRVWMRNPPDLPSDHDPGRVLLGDVDGDGLADCIYVEDEQVTLWTNRCGNGWSDGVEIEGTPPVTDIDAIRLVDIEGTGIGGLLYSGGGRPRSDEMYFLSLIAERKPYLLTRIANNMGASTRIEYAPSTTHLRRDRRESDGWRTSLPQPTWVVDNLQRIDEVSGGKLTTEFAYHDGYWDGAEKEFRGFGMVEQRDTETFESYHDDGGAFEDIDRERFSPPTLTKTWFHVGPVGPEHGDWRELDYSDEYWDGDPDRLDRPPSTRRLLEALPRRGRRDAVRSLQGRTLRSEVYGLDGSERADRPYEVRERVFGIREEARGREDGRGVFFPHERATRETRWERGHDPMTSYTFAGDYDEFGQQGTVTSIARPRDVAPGEPTGDHLVTHTERTFAQRDDNRYIVDRQATERTYEITDDAPRTVLELVAAIRDGSADRKPIGETRHFYDGAPFEGRDLGELGGHGALVRTESLVMTDETLAEAYPSTDPIPDADGPPAYLTSNDPNLSGTYPAAFDDALGARAPIARDGSPERAGYLYRDGTNGVAGYYAVDAQREFDVQSGAGGRGLLVATRDALGNETEIGYDTYDLFPVRVEDPTGLVTTADHDYNAMKPRQVTDPNGARVQNEYTPLGLVASVANLGRPGEREGDTLEQPTKQFEYGLRAYEQGPDDELTPAYVHLIERVKHRWDVVREVNERRRDNDEDELTDAQIESLFATERANSPEHFVEKRQYSDGFGRIVQTRTQAEDEVVGEDDTFGDDVLSADQGGSTPDSVSVNAVADDESRVRVTGWKIHDNKGNVVAMYEPFFLQTATDERWDFLSRAEAVAEYPETFRRKHVRHYDALGRQVRMIAPDGSEERTVYGVPRDIMDPTTFDPTPWEVYEYDANDNAGRTHGADASAYRHHWNTPSNRRVDALGRTVETVERNRTHDGGDDVQIRRTERTYDISGNVLEIIDPLGRVRFSADYDLKENELRSVSLDAGVEWVVRNAAGTPVERRDETGGIVLQRYDSARRPTHRWASEDVEQTGLTLRRRLIYGDADDRLTRSEAMDANLLGALHRRYDGAGLLRFDRQDFKGNVTRKVRRVLTDEAVVNQPVDWATSGDETLENREDDLLNDRAFRTANAYDAQDRVTRTRYPKDEEARTRHPNSPETDRTELQMSYARSGGLAGVDLVTGINTDDTERTTYVSRIGYTASGDRSFVAYGNDVMVRRAYDDQSGRLARQVTQRYRVGDGRAYLPTDRGTPLQDLGYEYDRNGNVRTIRDRSPNAGITDVAPGRDALDKEFEYDALERLTKATGREATDIPIARPWADTVQPADPSGYSLPDIGRSNAPDETTPYTETYEYDLAGNMTAMGHTSGRGGESWRRVFGMGGFEPSAWDPDGSNWTDEPTNHMTHAGRSSASSIGKTHDYDAAGNLLRERNSTYTWNVDSRLVTFEEQALNGTTSIEAAYAYDADGQRVKKVVDKGRKTVVTVSIDGVFEYRRQESSRETDENNTLHVMDDGSRIALVRVGDTLDDRNSIPAVRYHFGNHLDSSTLVIDGDGNWISYEEYTPFGATTFGGFASKRYRYSGKERDEESGLYYYGSRYYAPWVCRFRSVDPKERERPAVSGYALSANNPIVYGDRQGENPNKVLEEARKYLGTEYEQDEKRSPQNKSEEAISSMDCSEFVSRVYSDAYGMLDRWHTTESLLNHFEESPKWKQVKGEPKAGDVFIKRYKTGDKERGHTGIVIEKREDPHLDRGEGLMILHASGYTTSKEQFERKTMMELDEDPSAYKEGGGYEVPVTRQWDDVRADWEEKRKEVGESNFTGRFYRPTVLSNWDTEDVQKLQRLKKKHEQLQKQAEAVHGKLEKHTGEREAGQAPVPFGPKEKLLKKYMNLRSKMADVQDRIQQVRTEAKTKAESETKAGSVVNQATQQARQKKQELKNMEIHTPK